jgi:hypothetical protein
MPRRSEAILSGWQSRLWRDTASTSVLNIIIVQKSFDSSAFDFLFKQSGLIDIRYEESMNQFPRDASRSKCADTLIVLDYSIVNVNSKTDIEFIEFFAENDVNTIFHKTRMPRRSEAILSGWQSRLWRDTASTSVLNIIIVQKSFDSSAFDFLFKQSGLIDIIYVKGMYKFPRDTS